MSLNECITTTRLAKAELMGQIQEVSIVHERERERELTSRFGLSISTIVCSTVGKCAKTGTTQRQHILSPELERSSQWYIGTFEDQFSRLTAVSYTLDGQLETISRSMDVVSVTRLYKSVGISCGGSLTHTSSTVFECLRNGRQQGLH
jgi:hypothetical protein